MARSRAPGLLDTELDALPPELRWREWMARVEAIVFASSVPVTRDVLARIVGRECSIDLLMEDISHELAARPYEIVSVAGGWQFRTRTRHAQVLRAAFAELSSAAQITETEMLALASIAYHQPITRTGLANVLGREISRDVIARLRELTFVASGPRSPQPGAPYTYVTTKKFLEHFGLTTLADLPDVDALQEEGLLVEPTADGAEMLFAPMTDEDDPYALDD